MESLIKEHIEKFGVEPLVIGMYWNNQEYLYNLIEKAIESDKPYNEYDILSDEEKKAFNEGSLLF